MKIHKKFGTLLTVLCIISGFFVKFTVKADDISKEIITELTTETEITTEPTAETEITTEPTAETEIITEPTAETEITTKPAGNADMTKEQDNSEELQTERAEELSEAESKILDEIPMFEACLEYSPEGWIVKGVFKDIAADTILIQPMCSTDGETYQECGQEWNLQWLCFENEWELEKLQNQRCLYDSEEPLKSYLAKDLNRFYIKLRVVRKGGIAYETQAAMIDRGELQPVPAEFDIAVKFAPSVFVREGRPPDIQYYGRYQMTISEDATNEEISELLPDTLPVEIQLQKGFDYIGNDIMDCFVKWKPLNLLQLTAGESVTVLDAVEEIVIPAGTIVNTQTGIYQLNEAMSMNQYGITDEVRIVLNVVAKGGQPAGVLAEENHGLEMAFQLKPTGATSIRAYTITKGGLEWTELLGLSLIDAVNAQPSTANSGYTVVLGKEQEPYWSYRKAQEAGEEAMPFFVGLKIEGGVYDGRQLVLAWPDTYELPPDLPKVGGTGGNEGNVGSGNKNDSTESGQRPGLPQDSGDELTQEPLKEPKNKLLESELSKESMNEAIPAIHKAEIAENEMLENEIPEPGIESSEQQQEMVLPAQYEATVWAAAEDQAEVEEELSDGTSDTMTVMDMESFGYVEESTQPGIQKKPNRRISNAGSRVFVLITTCIAVLLCGGIIALQGTAGMKIVDALRRLFMRK